MEEIQRAAACSFILPPLLQDSRSCGQFMFPEFNALCKRDLALDKARSTTVTVQQQSHYQTDLNVKPEDMATIRSNKLLAQLEIDYPEVILREKA